ncbi:MAG: peptidoglycan DD-metalloendopeptidase family protein [Bacteroidota bacterium]
MSFFFIYLLKASFGISLVCLLYRFFLKKHTKFQANRIFLLTFLGLALIYPFLSINLNLQAGTTLAEGYSYVESWEDEWMLWSEEEGARTALHHTASNSVWNFGLILKLVYGLGLGIIAIPILTSWTKLIQLIRRSKFSYQAGLFWIQSNENKSFTAFNYIFIGKELRELSEEDKRRVIKHEEVHARQAHSLDLLFLDLLQIMFWFLPLIPLLKRDMKDLHEYLADAKVAHQENKYAYSRLLLKLVHKDSTQHTFPLHSFAYSPIKHRINMLLKKPTQSLRYLILPSLMGILLMFGSACQLEVESQIIEEKAELEDQLAYSLQALKSIQDLEDHAQSLKEALEGVSQEPSFIVPMEGKFVAGFGWRTHPIEQVKKMHWGMDYNAPTGTPVKASAEGTVSLVKRSKGGYGKQVEVTHGNGFVTKYAHLSEIKVKVGQKLNQGEVLGLCGSSGKSKGPHLHFELMKNGKKINPEKYLK